MTRGVIYITWGDVGPLLDRSLASLSKWHPELPTHIVRLPEGSGLLDKASMADVTPFDSTLFLDADTVVMGRLDYGFQQAERFGLACAICECPWARRYASEIQGDTREFNTGVLFWTQQAKPVFDAWKRLSLTMDSSINFHGPGGAPMRMPENDQGPFAKAIVETGFNPCVLPMNWNLRPQWHRSWFGPVRIWHDRGDPYPSLEKWNAEQDAPSAMIRYAETKRNGA